MITKEDAIEIAQDYISQEEKKSNYNLVLLLNNTIEFDLGWVFYYQSREFLETGDILEMLGGNAPIIVNKANGNVYVTGTADPIEKYIKDYRKIFHSNHY